MPRRTLLALALLAIVLPASRASAQMSSTAFRDEFLGQFDASAEKLVALARAIPAEHYGWEPMEGVASVAQAFMHIARYNYGYPATALGVPAPAGIDYESWEAQVTDKERAVAILERSMEHVRQVARGMDAAALEKQTRLYGRDVPQWAVLFQLITHMNEHLGQEIAYARMNGVVPPWSR